MNPDELRAWFPVLRDYVLLVAGIAAGIYGVVTKQAGVASVGWGLAGIGAVGRAGTSSA